jgi:hypothetical protein
MNRKLFRILLTAMCAASVARAENSALFESKIRPLLVEHCYECHSAEKKQKGNLLLDTQEATLKGGDTGPALVPGDPANSLLLRAVKWTDKDLQMPPKKKLTDSQIADLEAWIQAGAPDPRTKPRTLTKIEQHLKNAEQHWSFQPIPDLKPDSLDALIGPLSAPPAERRTLIRRAYLDLLGVPPTYAEVQSFAADTDPKAFEILIDKLLADPRYGERWGRHWLDVTRYADTVGGLTGGNDAYPYAHTYRDYVIEAFNSDKPYDRFLLEQIAADQLDTAKDIRTLRAMGFLGIGRRKDRKPDDDFFDDTLDVLGRGILGLSIGCARCHDHKLEPITTKDYYGLYAVLRSSKEPGVLPLLPTANSPEAREYAEKNRNTRNDYGIASIRAAIQTRGAARSRLGEYLEVAAQSDWKTRLENKKITPVLNQRKLLPPLYDAIVLSRKEWIDAHPEIFAPFIEFSTQVKLDPAPVLHPAIASAFATPAKDLAEIAKRYNEVFNRVDAAWRGQIEPELSKPLTLSEDELELDDKALQPKFIVRLDKLDAEHSLQNPTDESLRKILNAKGSPLKIGAGEYARLSLFSEEDRRLFVKLGLEVDKLTKHPCAPARAMAWTDSDTPYNGRVFIRGNPTALGAEAPRQFLSVLQHVSPEPFPKNQSGRLQLAQAIASPKNPLTARVIVNRVWGWHFGDPIVGTPSDFGFRGDKPANQPLLDHLAAWFIQNGWSFKRLHKYLLLTSAYQRADFPMRPLELEPFRDALLSVTGRLKSAPGGKPDEISQSNRRTVYSLVDRKMLPSLYRSFDFPDPNFSAPKRNRTALTPRALILLNSPLLTDSAKTLAASLTREIADNQTRVDELYRRVLQRQPTEQETQRALAYVAAYPKNDLVHPESQAWQYGFGAFDSTAKQVKDFTPMPTFDGKTFRAAGVMLDATGGDSGADSKQSTVRRWVAPLDGEVRITAELYHSDPKSEGVTARVLSSRAGLLGEWTAHQQAVCTDLAKIRVNKGDALDFIVSSVNGKETGAYQWSPSIVMPGVDMPAMPGMARRWDARVDFSDPNSQLKPLSAWEELAQAILLSPEFAVLE